MQISLQFSLLNLHVAAFLHSGFFYILHSLRIYLIFHLETIRLMQIYSNSSVHQLETLMYTLRLSTMICMVNTLRISQYWLGQLLCRHLQV